MSTVSPYLSIMISNGNRLKTESGRVVEGQAGPDAEALVSHSHDNLDFIPEAMGTMEDYGVM